MPSTERWHCFPKHRLVGSPALGPATVSKSHGEGCRIRKSTSVACSIHVMHLSERVQLEKLWCLVCFAHLHRRHFNLGTDISSCDQCFECVFVPWRRPQFICSHMSARSSDNQAAIPCDLTERPDGISVGILTLFLSTATCCKALFRPSSPVINQSIHQSINQSIMRPAPCNAPRPLDP